MRKLHRIFPFVFVLIASAALAAQAPSLAPSIPAGTACMDAAAHPALSAQADNKAWNSQRNRMENSSSYVIRAKRILGTTTSAIRYMPSYRLTVLHGKRALSHGLMKRFMGARIVTAGATVPDVWASMLLYTPPTSTPTSASISSIPLTRGPTAMSNNRLVATI